MSRRICLYIAVSLDGFIAGVDDELAWLDAAMMPNGEDYGFAALLERVDTLLMGRRTWHVTRDLAEWPYGDRRGIVFSRQPYDSESHVEYVSTNVGEYTRQLLKQPGKDVWLVGGGELIKTFLEENLIDEMIITTLPQILGEGIPLFPSGSPSSRWTLTGVEHWPESGVIQTRYCRSVESTVMENMPHGR